MRVFLRVQAATGAATESFPTYDLPACATVAELCACQRSLTEFWPIF